MSEDIESAPVEIAGSGASAQTTVDPDAVSVAPAVANAVGAVTETPPLDLSPPLYTSVDVDALDRLCTDSQCTVTFDYLNTTVSIEHGGTVTAELHPSS